MEEVELLVMLMVCTSKFWIFLSFKASLAVLDQIKDEWEVVIDPDVCFTI